MNHRKRILHPVHDFENTGPLTVGDDYFYTDLFRSNATWKRFNLVHKALWEDKQLEAFWGI